MIAVDTSALMAILLSEPEAEACAEALETDGRIVISAVTAAEALIVAQRRGLGAEMAGLIDRVGLEVLSVAPPAARRVAGAYAKWGRGVHPAALNFGDCFAYETAKSSGCPLLFVGEDFAQTDVASVL